MCLNCDKAQTAHTSQVAKAHAVYDGIYVPADKLLRKSRQKLVLATDFETESELWKSNKEEYTEIRNAYYEQEQLFLKDYNAKVNLPYQTFTEAVNTSRTNLNSILQNCKKV